MTPAGDPAQVEAAWDDLDQTLERMRVVFEMPVEGHFESSFVGLLSARGARAVRGVGAPYLLSRASRACYNLRGREG